MASVTSKSPSKPVQALVIDFAGIVPANEKLIFVCYAVR